MPNKKQPKEFKVIKRDGLDEAEKANRAHLDLQAALFVGRKNALFIWELLWKIREYEWWRLPECGEHPSWNSYCASPEIKLAPASANQYADTYEYHHIERKIPIKKAEGISEERLIALKSVPDPEKYFPDAKERGRNDFFDLMKSVKTGVPEDKITADRMKKKAQQAFRCPHCGKTIYPGTTLKAPKKKADDLI